jgi:excisionase family DNA binding protein
MAQFYTLEEAAKVLGMSADELKAKAQSREVRAFLDGGSWRFRVVDVDELARRRGLGSDAELRLSDLDLPGGKSSGELEEVDLSEFHLGVNKADLGSESAHISKVEKGKRRKSADTGSDHDILLDDLTVPPNLTGSSSVIIGAPTSGGRPSDSDVRLVPETVRGASDSDVQLASPSFKQPSDSDVTLIKEDTADHGIIRGSSSSSDTSVRVSPLLGSSAEVPAAASDSDFEMNPSSELIDALQPDSGSDFELSALDASDEFEATPMSKASDSDVTASDPKLAGINLSRPSDSGINLQTGGLGLGQADSIELAPLSDEALETTQRAKNTSSKAKPSKAKPSLSATPPPSVKKGEKDIFDDTDFEVDVNLSDGDSDDKTVQLEAASDFDLEDNDTGSEVFAIDEEAVDQNASTAMAPSAFAEDDEDEDDDGFDSAVSSEMGAWSSSSEGGSSGQERSQPAMVMARDADQEWSGIWVGLLAFTTVCLLFAAFVAHDLVRNMYEYQSGGTMGSGLVRMISGMFGG